MTNSVFLTRSDLRKVLGCSIETINNMVERGELPKPIQLVKNSKIRFVRAEVDQSLKALGIDLNKLESLAVGNANDTSDPH